MDFTVLYGKSNIDELNNVKGCRDLINNRNVCYYVRGKSKEEVSEVLEDNREIDQEGTGYHIIAEGNRGSGCFIFLDPDYFQIILTEIFESLGVVMESEWSVDLSNQV